MHFGISSLALNGPPNGFNLEPSVQIFEFSGAQIAKKCPDLQAPICSALEFVQLATLGYPASSPSEVEPVGDLVSASASLT